MCTPHSLHNLSRQILLDIQILCAFHVSPIRFQILWFIISECTCTHHYYSLITTFFTSFLDVRCNHYYRLKQIGSCICGHYMQLRKTELNPFEGNIQNNQTVSSSILTILFGRCNVRTRVVSVKSLSLQTEKSTTRFCKLNTWRRKSKIKSIPNVILFSFILTSMWNLEFYVQQICEKKKSEQKVNVRLWK